MCDRRVTVTIMALLLSSFPAAAQMATGNNAVGPAPLMSPPASRAATADPPTTGSIGGQQGAVAQQDVATVLGIPNWVSLNTAEIVANYNLMPATARGLISARCKAIVATSQNFNRDVIEVCRVLAAR